MKKDISTSTRYLLSPLIRLLIAITVLGLSGCNDQDGFTVAGSTPDTPEAAQGGDDYWAELAQSYPAFIKPPELASAYPPDEWISFGRWDDTFDWPLIATGAANLPDGRIVAWSSQKPHSFFGRVESTVGTIYNPADSSFEPTPNSTHDMFCAGVSMLEDGRVFVAGGGHSVSTTSVFDTDQFSEIESMAMSRWYPTSTTMATGQVFTSLGTRAAPYPEVWTDGKGWSLIPDINLQQIIDSENVVHNDWYPAFNVAPDGSLFHPGHMPDILSVYLDQEHGVHDHDDHSDDEPSRLYNTTVMYDIGKVLVAGGGSGSNATNSALTMDVNGPSPIVTSTNPMKHVRSMQNSVVLPNGEVLVIGGNSSGVQFSDEGTVLEPELWNPQTEQWRVLAFHDKPRNYHSVALLLKDARVLAAGGGLCGGCQTNHQNGEIYSPPYLFNADGTPAQRPEISGGTATALPGDTVTVNGTDDIVKFNMVRLVAITHHHTTDQRLVPIDSVKVASGQYDLTLNSNANILLPGYYWIFGLDQNGVPSEGHTIQINVRPENQPDISTDTSPNIAYEYYESSWPDAKLPDFDELTPVKTGTQSDFSLAAKERNSNYAFRFRGSITAPADGQYTFFLSSDDGSKLLINDKVVVDHDGMNSFESEKSGAINLTAGQHDIEVQFFEISEGDALLASWQGPTFDKRPISAVDLGSPSPAPSGGNTDKPNQGMVSYKYFEGQWQNLPDFDNQTVLKEGEVAGFDLSPRLSDDFYGFEYTANITIPNNGNYTFYTRSDDGSRLSINDTVIVNNDGRHSPKEQSGIVALTAGTHQLKVEFFEHNGGDILEVNWQGPGIAKQAIPTSALATGPTEPTPDPDIDPDTDPDPTEADGLINYQYFEGQWSALPDFNQLAPVSEGQQSGFSLAPKQDTDNYGFRFATYLNIPEDGLYTFYLASDDGSRLSIDGEQLINNDGLHANRELSDSLFLTAGQHHVLVEYFERGGLDNLDISWSTTNMAKQSLDNASLSSANFNQNPDPDNNISDQSNIQMEYYEGTWTSLPDFNQLTPVSTGTAAQFTLPPSNGVLNYGYRFTGKILVDQAGNYTFYTSSNDGSQLRINNELVVDNDGKHVVQERQGLILLTPGLHDIEVTYFQSGGGEALDVYWSGGGMAKQLIGSQVLFAP